MKNIDKNIDQKIKESFDRLDAKAPDHLWAGINKKLDAEWESSMDEKIKKSFEERPLQKAPPLLWTTIAEGIDEANALDTKIDQKIKESAKEVPLIKAPPKVWKGIQRQLNIDKTWTAISNELEERPVVTPWSKRLYQMTGVAAAIMLLLHTCDYNPIINTKNNAIAQENSTQQNSIQQANTSEEQKKKLANRNTFSIKETNTKNSNLNEGENTKKDLSDDNVTKKITNTKDINRAANNSTKATYKTSSSLGNTTKIKKVAKKIKTIPTIAKSGASLEQKDINNSTDNTVIVLEEKEGNVLEENLSTPSNLLEIDEKVEERQNWAVIQTIKRQLLSQKLTLPEKVITLTGEPTIENNNLFKDKLRLGAFVVVNSTMLLNEETREGFRTPEVQNYFGLAFNYGLWASYQILPKGRLIAEFSFNADNKQGYGIYDAADFYIKEWVIKYNRVSMAYQQDLFATTGKKIDTKIVGQLGMYLGILREAKLFYNGDLFFDAIGEHHRLDLGFKIALGQEIDFGRLVIGYGIRSDIGVSNIFRGNSTFSAQENYTNLIHLGGYMTLGYKF